VCLSMMKRGEEAGAVLWKTCAKRSKYNVWRFFAGLGPIGLLLLLAGCTAPSDTQVQAQRYPVEPYCPEFDTLYVMTCALPENFQTGIDLLLDGKCEDLTETQKERLAREDTLQGITIPVLSHVEHPEDTGVVRLQYLYILYDPQEEQPVLVAELSSPFSIGRTEDQPSLWMSQEHIWRLAAIAEQTSAEKPLYLVRNGSDLYYLVGDTAYTFDTCVVTLPGLPEIDTEAYALQVTALSGGGAAHG
jgi:hypothetical protein